MHRNMRRKEKEMGLDETKSFIGIAEVGRLAMSLNDNPYVVPVNFVYHQGKIYIHCAGEGQKIDYISGNPRICFEVDEFLGIKTIYEPCNCGSKYRSVIAYGNAELIENTDEKRLVLRKFV